MSLFSGLFQKKITSKYSLIIDIGSESIGAAFVELSDDNNPFVIDSERHLIPFQEKINIKRFIELMKETLSITINELKTRNKEIIPKSCLVTLASPWHASQTRVVHINSKENFLITENGLKEMLNNEAQTFVVENSKQSPMSNNSIIESHIIEVKINGYALEKPVGRKTDNIELYMHITSSPDSIICSLKEILEKNWPHTKIVFHSFMFSLYNTIRDKFDKSSSFLIIDVAGEVTDISLVRNDVLLESISFPLGYRVFLRRLAAELSLEPENAYSEIKLWQKNKMSKERSDQISSIFNKVVADWIILFSASLKKMSEKNILPRTIYLVSEKEYDTSFANAIFDKSSDILGENQEKFKVRTLNSELLSKFITDRSVNKSEDTFLYVTIIMLEKLLTIENNYNQYICQKT